MKAFILQTSPIWQDARSNISFMEDFIVKTEAIKSDLILLPEMWASGFSVAEPIYDQQAQEWMQDAAQRYGCAIAGTLVVKENDQYFNRFYFYKPDGSSAHYDKRHLFGHEKQLFTAGERCTIVNWKGFRILLQTCYDLRFPGFSRNRNDYDIALYAASWPSSRQDAWTTLLKARAIENQCYVLGANRTGDDPHLHYTGGSVAYSFSGALMTDLKDKICAKSVEIDLLSLTSFRQKFPFLQDADTY